MKKRNLLIGGLAGLGLSVASVASAAPMVNVGLELWLPDGSAELPKVGEVYQVQANQEFLVNLILSVTEPNMTHGERPRAGQQNKPLGVQAIAVDILSQGVNLVSPVPSGGVWGEATDLDSASFVKSANLLDLDADGDLDVAQAGMANLGIELPSTLIGDNQANTIYAIGAKNPIMLMQGLYKAGANGGTTALIPMIGGATVYADNEPDVLLQIVDAATNATPVQIQILGGSTPTEVPVALTDTGSPSAIVLNIIRDGEGKYRGMPTPVNAASGQLDASAITDPGDVWLMLDLSGPLPDGVTVQGAVGTADPMFIELDKHYDFDVLVKLTGTDRFINFDFSAAAPGVTVLSATAVPEPATMGLLALAGLGLLARRRR